MNPQDSNESSGNEGKSKSSRNRRQERRNRLKAQANVIENSPDDSQDNSLQEKDQTSVLESVVEKVEKPKSKKARSKKSSGGQQKDKGHRNKAFTPDELKIPNSTKIQKVLKELRDDVIEHKNSDLLDDPNFILMSNPFGGTDKPFQRVDLNRSEHKSNFFNKSRGILKPSELESGRKLSETDLKNRKNVSFLGSFTFVDCLTQFICYILVGFLLWLNIFGIGSLSEPSAGNLSHLFIYIYNTLLSIFIILIVFGFLNRIDTLDKVGFFRLSWQLTLCIVLLVSHFLMKSLELKLIECRMYNSTSEDLKKHIHLTYDCGDLSKNQTIFNKHPALALTSSILATLSALLISISIHSNRNESNFLTRFKLGN